MNCIANAGTFPDYVVTQWFSNQKLGPDPHMGRNLQLRNAYLEHKKQQACTTANGGTLESPYMYSISFKKQRNFHETFNCSLKEKLT